MVHMRGQKEDWDHWAAPGNRGWGRDQVPPVFQSLQDSEHGAADSHGAGGEVRVAEPRVALLNCMAPGRADQQRVHGRDRPAGAGRAPVRVERRVRGERHAVGGVGRHLHHALEKRFVDMWLKMSGFMRALENQPLRPH
jgi:choline dehydrogenase-like flavoprotein